MKVSKFLVANRPNFGPYNISPTTLKFDSKEDERHYRNIITETYTNHTQFSLVLAMTVNFAYGLLDTYIYEGEQELYYAYMIRLFSIFLPVTALLVVMSIRKFEAYALSISQIGYFIVGISWFLFSFRTTEQVVAYNFPAVVMTYTCGYFFIRLFFINAFLVGFLITLVYSLSIWSVEMPFAAALSMNTSLVVIFMFLTLAAYQKELISRQLFVSERKERESLRRQAQIDTRYLDWLRQLAQFLRHEVRQPVAQINTSIELLQLTPALDSHAQLHLETATLSTKTVWTLIERASRATDATAFVRQGKPEKIEIDAFLRGISESFRQTYSGVEISYKRNSQGWVMIDRTALQETVGNLLSNAASYADEGSCIDLNLRVEADHVTVSVTNKGPLIDTNTEDLFRPFASTRSGSLSEHQGLGLYLVRLITEHYNGASGIRNQEDRSGVEAFFSLPRTS